MYSANDGIASPCYHCKERKVGCHGECKKYLDYQEEIKEFNKNRKAAIDAYVNGMYAPKGRRKK